MRLEGQRSAIFIYLAEVGRGVADVTLASHPDPISGGGLEHEIVSHHSSYLPCQ